MTSDIISLTEKDKRMLIDSGIPLKLQAAYGIRRVTDEEGALIVGQQRKAGREFGGVLFPIFSGPNQTQPTEYELRRDVPDITIENGTKKETGKYLRPPGRGNLLALPHNVSSEDLNDVSIPILVCEGIKKMLAALYLSTWNLAVGKKARFIPVSIPGVNNWRGKVGKITDASGQKREIKGLISGFHSIPLKRRSVIISFDNDVHTNFKVKLARHNLAETLQSETSAICYFADLPRDEKKIGLDDFLGSLNGDLSRGLELLETKYRFSNSLESILLDGKIIIAATGGDRGKSILTAKNIDGENIAMDSFNLAEADKRNKFVKQIENILPLSVEERAEIQREILGLAEICGALSDTTAPEIKSNEVIQTSFQVLKDGRIIEQIRSGFAVYNPDSNEHCILETITDADGVKYEPIDDDLFNDGGFYVANDLTEYGTEKEIIGEIEKYLSRYLDLRPLHLKLSALYVLFTYIYDKVLELSYINATGDAGSGKSRFGLALALASRRGLVLITPSAASVYRIVDKFHPTMFLDEFNGADSDDAAAIIQILNAGFQRTGKIARQLSKGDGSFKTELFDPYCPKIIGSLKQSNSNAFNSRCIEIQMERTTRNDIPLSLSFQMLEDAQTLQNKLTLYRLRNYHIDFEAKRRAAEFELRSSGIVPRSVQVNTPLYALIESEETKKEFINLLLGRDAILAEEKALSLDGEIVDKLHTLLFESFEDEDTSELKTILNSRNFQTLPINDVVCEQLRLERLRDMVNDKKPKEITAQFFGKLIIGLGLRTKKILTRKSDYRDQKAIIFNIERLAYLFKINNLPVSNEFNVTNVTKTDNPNNSKDLKVVTLGEKGDNPATICHQTKLENEITYATGDLGDKQNQEVGAKGENTDLSPDVSINTDFMNFDIFDERETVKTGERGEI